jgi:uncharacterized protein
MRLAWLILCAGFSAAGLAAQETTVTAAPPEQANPADEAFDQAVQAVRDKKFRRAVDLFLPLAQAGAADAQYNLAVLLKLGRGRPQNYRDAYYWAALSSLGGETRAPELVNGLQSALPDKDRDAVVKQLQELLAQQITAGDDTAPEKLARLYADFAIKPDMESAFIWFSICYAIGKADCEAGMARTSDGMAAETLIKVQATAAEVFAESAFAKP